MSTITNPRMAANKIQFNCECNGCRNYSRRPAEIWHESQIASKTNGYYFSRETMRLFSSRIVDFKRIESNLREDLDGLAVIVSSRYDTDNSTRYYEILTICAYGDVTRPYTNIDGDPIVKHDSLKSARAAYYLLGALYPCSCHGCQLDKAGR